MVFGFIRMNQREHGLKMRAGIAVNLGLVLKISRDQLQRGLVIGFGANRVNEWRHQLHK